MSTRTYHQFACQLPQPQADALNMESARIYNAVMVEHWRIYRKKGVWLRQGTAEKLNDNYDADTSKRGSVVFWHSATNKSETLNTKLRGLSWTGRKNGRSACWRLVMCGI